MNETRARHLLAELAAQVPDRPAPVDDVVGHGRVVRARRRRRVGAAAAVAVALVVAGGLLLPRLGGASDGDQTAATDPSGAGDLPAATRQVALGRVVATVPGSWSSDQPAGCLEVPQGGVAVSDLRVDCTTADSNPGSTVVIAPTRPMVGDREDLALERVDHDGLDLLVQPEPQCEPGADGTCSLRVAVPAAGVVVQVSTPKGAPAGLTTAIVDSVALLPEDHFAVPPDLVGARLGLASRTLREAGAEVGSSTGGGPEVVTEVDPTAGSVLETGTEVNLRYGDPVGPAPDVDLEGTWSISAIARGTGDPIRAQVVFDDTTVRVGRCGPWTGTYVSDGDEIRFTDLVDDGSSGTSADCRDDAAAVADLLGVVEHVTRAGSKVFLHRRSYEIVATLTR